MIKTEHPFEGNENLIRTYTTLENTGLLQNETGILYGDSVIDIFPCPYTYTEQEIVPEEEEETDNLAGEEEVE